MGMPGGTGRRAPLFTIYSMICHADIVCSSCNARAAQTMAEVLLVSFDELHAVFPLAVLVEWAALDCFGLGHFGAMCPGSPQ